MGFGRVPSNPRGTAFKVNGTAHGSPEATLSAALGHGTSVHARGMWGRGASAGEGRTLSHLSLPWPKGHTRGSVAWVTSSLRTSLTNEPRLRHVWLQG